MRGYLARIFRLLSLDLRLATRNVLRQGRRSSAGLSAVAAGVVALLLASGFFEWNYERMRDGIIRARIGHIQLVRAGYMNSGIADPFAFLIPEGGKMVQNIERHQEVVTVAPRLEFNGLISLGESTLSFIGEGVAPDKERVLSGALRIVDGENLADQDSAGVIIGQGLAQNLGAHVGQTIVLVVNTRSGGINAVEMRVKGTFETLSKAYDDYALQVPLATAQKLLHVFGVHRWLVLLQRTQQTYSMLETLHREVGSTQLELIPWDKTAEADFYKKTESLFSKQVFVVEIMIAVIIVLSISNTMMTNVRERIAEIGTTMALGDRQSTVLRRFLAEGAVLGLFGGLIGTVVGVGLAQLISHVGIPMPPPPGMASGFRSGILVTPPLIVEALALSVSTALLAGLYPAWRASRLSIHDALRHAL